MLTIAQQSNAMKYTDHVGLWKIPLKINMDFEVLKSHTEKKEIRSCMKQLFQSYHNLLFERRLDKIVVIQYAEKESPFLTDL